MFWEEVQHVRGHGDVGSSGKRVGGLQGAGGVAADGPRQVGRCRAQPGLFLKEKGNYFVK